MARIAACSHLVHDLCPKTGSHFSGSCRCCRSSVVEHSLGKGEVVSSILTGSTRKAKQTRSFSEGALPFLPVLEREQSVFPPAKLGENPGNLFGKRSAFLDRASAKKKNRNWLER